MKTKKDERVVDVPGDLEAQFFATIEEQERDYLLTVKNLPKRRKSGVPRENPTPGSGRKKA